MSPLTTAGSTACSVCSIAHSGPDYESDMEYLIFIELGLVAIIAGVIFWVMRNIKKEKANQTNKE